MLNTSKKKVSLLKLIKVTILIKNKVMTQEEKDLLLKDLSARLPYGVKFQSENIETALFVDTSDDEVWINGTCIDDFKPYLFPMSSLTEEQRKELFYISGIHIIYGKFYTNDEFTLEETLSGINWLLKNHFDINGLIPKGLAIDATGLNMY
jgi:hypothetical protein